MPLCGRQEAGSVHTESVFEISRPAWPRDRLGRRPFFEALQKPNNFDQHYELSIEQLPGAGAPIVPTPAAIH